MWRFIIYMTSAISVGPCPPTCRQLVHVTWAFAIGSACSFVQSQLKPAPPDRRIRSLARGNTPRAPVAANAERLPMLCVVTVGVVHPLTHVKVDSRWPHWLKSPKEDTLSASICR